MKRITLRLNDELIQALEAAADRNETTASEEARRRLARSLRVPVPDMPTGAAGHGEGCGCVSCRNRN